MIRGMRAAILAVGSELLGTERLDTNSLRLTAVLERFGVELVGKSICGDDEGRIAEELRRWAAAAELVVVSGGLGPTADDVTRAAAARAFDRTLAVDEGIVAGLRRRFASLGREMAEVNRRQAEVISGAEVLENPRGSAPGQRLVDGGATVFLLPGVPVELEGLAESCLVPWLRERTESREAATRHTVAKLTGLPESQAEEALGPFYERYGRDGVSVLASPGEVQVHLTARGEAEHGRLEEKQAFLRELVGPYLFTENAGETLEAVVGRLLTERGSSVATAESCTGGLVGERLTRVPGSSAYYLAGVVTYSNEAKTRLLGVSEGMLAEHGAVSEPVARTMAREVATRNGAGFGCATTGVAGPGGGSEAKPVGTVHVAVAEGGETYHRRVRFPGDRDKVRWQTSQLLLDMLRRLLQGLPVEGPAPVKAS